MPLYDSAGSRNRTLRRLEVEREEEEEEEEGEEEEEEVGED